MNKDTLLTEIMQLDFACYDLRLYLNTHTDDKNAIERYNHLRRESNQFRAEYENQYGPLSYSAPSNDDMFDWTDEPWPWEKTFMDKI